MPKQRVLFGRPLPRMPPRRISFLLGGVAVFAVLMLMMTLPSVIPTGPSLSKFTDHRFSIPRLNGGFGSGVWNPFRAPSHAPPRAANDTYGDVSWFDDWKWLSIPFSSSVTLDEDRALLPPLKERRPVYCYYDTMVERDKATKEAEGALLLTWRRAWWAQGFMPIILSAAEATNNPLYKELEKKDDVDPTLKADIMRWLAWETMGGGLLSHHLALPMAAFADPLLAYTRRGEYPQLTRWKGLGNGLFAGSKAEIANAVRVALSSTQRRTAKDFVTAVSGDDADELFKIDKAADAIAYYSPQVIAKKYAKVGTEMASNRPSGLKSLNQLINSHLHNTWQNVFKDGIAVLKPLPAHSSKMVDPAFQLAHRLAHCGESPMLSSCPPNLPKCNPCVASQGLKVTTPARYKNASSGALYTIGTVPHPYTMATLGGLRPTLDVAWIRRESDRDPWLTALTKDIIGPAVSSGPRLLRFKDAVAGDHARPRSLWLAAEEAPHVLADDNVDIDWHFGFAVPHAPIPDGKSETPVPGPERRPSKQPPHDPADGPVPKPEELAREPDLLKRAAAVVKLSSRRGALGHPATSRKDKAALRIRAAVEAWNLGDTEAWRFARGFAVRERVVRLKWEEEEAKYEGGAGWASGKPRRRSGWGPWLGGE